MGPVNLVNHTSWVAVVIPTDRPKSVRNCCLIELLSLCPFDISVGVGDFVIGLGQISSFLSLSHTNKIIVLVLEAQVTSIHQLLWSCVFSVGIVAQDLPSHRISPENRAQGRIAHGALDGTEKVC